MKKKEKEIAVWNYVVLIALLRLISLVIVLVWVALVYDRLLANPFLAVLLVLGVLVILFGGTIRFGPIKIQKAPRPQHTPAFQMIGILFGSY